MNERFFNQAYMTFHSEPMRGGYIIDAYNMKVNKTGISPTITTRPEGFKTAILVVVNGNNSIDRWRTKTPSS